MEEKPQDKMQFMSGVRRAYLQRCVQVCVAAFVVLVFCAAAHAQPQPLSLSQRVASTAVERWPAGRIPVAQAAEKAVLFDGMDAVWYDTADRAYFQYVKQIVDNEIEADKSPDDGALGRQLMMLYRVTQNAKYYTAAARLYTQLSTRFQEAKPLPRIELAIDAPFVAEYAAVLREPQEFPVITRQFVLIDGQGRSAKSEATSLSDTIGVGYSMAALVDALPYYPSEDSGRPKLLAILNRTAEVVVRSQDKSRGSWSQFPSDCLLTYALAKAVRLGYLPRSYSRNATHAWLEIQHRVAGGRQNTSVTVTDAFNTPGAAGAFLLVASEMEIADSANPGRHPKVVVDAWFNSQQRVNAAGKSEYFHYKWDDFSDSGFSLLGHIFEQNGAVLDTLYSAPTFERLKGAQFYIIASPDIPVKNPHPNYARSEDGQQLAEWVKQGGVLVLMENDPANADIEHFNQIADRFGIHFNSVLSHHVIGDNFAGGLIKVSGDGPVFQNAFTLYMKDTCTISLKAPAVSLLQDQGDILMAKVQYGRGVVIAVADPWLYNEYTDRRKLAPEQDNFPAGKDWVRWLLKQSPDYAGFSTQP
jgi:unsaturated rhamnogalacturonyl hydrolase